MSGETLDPWDVEQIEVPAEETRSARLESLVRYAVLAPSTHNSQPWRFRIRGDALEILADRTRSLQASDPHGRELTISCGAALGFARLGARVHGIEGNVELAPDPGEPDLLARLHLGFGVHSTAAEARRFGAIAVRRTSRTPFEDDPEVDSKVVALPSLTRAYGIRLSVTRSRETREKIAELVASADRRQMADPAIRRELARWISGRSSGSGEGMSLSSFGLDDRLSGPAAAVIGAINFGKATAAKHRRLAEQTPWLALLSSLEDDPKSWLRTGMALADITLELAAAGISYSFLNQPIELADMRSELEGLFEAEGFPQMLMRIGRGTGVPAAARRGAHEVSEV